MSIGSIRRETAKIEFKNDFPCVATVFKNFAYLPLKALLCWLAISAYLCHTVIHSLYGSKLCQFQQPCHQRCQQPRHPAGQVPGAGLGAPHPLLQQPHPPIRFLLCFYRNLAPVLGSVSQLAALWEAMFPLQLLLHHLDQYRNLVEAAWWQEDWLLALITDISTIGHCLLFLSL